MSTIADSSSRNNPAGFPWLFSARVDLGVFLGSALLSLTLLAVGGAMGILHRDTPGWAWVSMILLIDVAHVYATGFRVYFDRAELARRPGLYFGVPLLAFLVGLALYALGGQVFWRVLAYLAVFHFIRQQYGWVALYRAKAQERELWGRRLDTAAIYLATLYPLIYWHGHLPRGFEWFLPQDFLAGLPETVADVLAPIYWGVMALYLFVAARRWRHGRGNPGKDIVVATTAVCWYVGIITFNSDYAFTVTNVIIHGVPYMALVYWYWQMRENRPLAVRHSSWRMLVMFLGTIWLLAYFEELMWDRTIWQQRGWLFGDSYRAEGWKFLLVPLLAVPQWTHYLLDGFIWKRGKNPEFARIAQELVLAAQQVLRPPGSTRILGRHKSLVPNAIVFAPSQNQRAN